MPIWEPSVSDLAHYIIRANCAFSDLDWEIEDLCSERLLAAFENDNPSAVARRRTIAGRTHREFNRRAKPELRRYFIQRAESDDVREIVALLKALRSYLRLDHNFIDP
jgi:hypothetical protein